LLTLSLPLERGNSFRRVSEVGGGFIRAIFGRPTCPFNKVMHYILKLPFVTNFLNFLFILGVFQIRHHHKVLVVFVAAVRLEELNGEHIMESGVLSRQGYSVGLATNTLKYSKQANPAWRQFPILNLKVFYGKLDKVSYFKLL